MGGNGLIARSFMMMSFLTAMLLIAVQGLQETAFSSRSSRFPSRPLATGPAPTTQQSQVSMRRLAVPGAAPTVPAPTVAASALAVVSQDAHVPPAPASPGSTPPGQGGGTGGHGSSPALALPEPQAASPSFSQSLIPTMMGRLLGRSTGTFVPAVADLSTLLAPLPDRVVQVVVDLSDRQVYLYQGTEEIGRYAVAIGKDGWATPTGRFQVIDMRMNPHWQHPITRADVPPGPDNPLGSRWIAFLPMEDGVIGFHGTYQTELIGQAVSHGCIRMHNADIEAMFSHLTLGVAVTVRP